MSKWMFLCLALVTAASGCTSDDESPQVTCERIDVNGTEYCTYAQPITETGYDCPQDLPNAISFEEHTVCSSEEQIPSEHAQPIRDHFEGDSLDGGTDTADGGTDTADGGTDTADSGECGGQCDAILIPSVTFDFTQPDGEPFCGDVTISYWGEGEEDSPTTKNCTCSQMQPADVGIDETCYVMPPAGEVSYIKVEATEAAYDDYAPFETSVDLPCQCHPTAEVDVEFELAE